jgi:predicted polyphosphate/ATP-dependent NAD kinase
VEEVTVGVVANPASGRDIRRLVSGASVFDNAEKGSMVRRLMAGLGAAGVGRVLLMPAGDGLGASVHRGLRANRSTRLPALEELDMPLDGSWRDSERATLAMAERGVRAIVVLGGDGTHRVVSRACGDVPLCALSTGTNNCFPEVREATVAGLATGLVATGRVDGPALRRAKLLLVERPGHEPDRALVDVAVTTARFTGARALWRPQDAREIVVTFARAGAVGLSAVAGMLDPVPRDAPHGLHVRLAPLEEAETVLTVPLAPGLVVPVGIEGVSRVGPGETVELAPTVGSVALDGEREIEIGPKDAVEVSLDPDGPLTIDVGAAMREAARLGLLNGTL